MEPNIYANPEPISTPSEPTFEPKKSLPKWPLIIVGVILLATLLTGAFVLNKNINVNQKPASKITQIIIPTTTPNPELPGKVIWAVQKLNLTPTEIEIKNAFTAYTATPSTKFNSNHRLAVNSLEISTVAAGFAYANMELLDAKNQTLPIGGFAFFLYKTSGAWNIIMESASNFCEEIKTFPNDIITEDFKDYFAGCFPK
jgi:hypothetical protein